MPLAVAAMIAVPAGGDGSAAETQQARKTLQHCGAAERVLSRQDDRYWFTPDDVMPKHVALRTALGEPMPRSDTMVLIYAEGGHLATSQISVLLVRRADGSWMGTQVGQSRIWTVGAPWTRNPRRDWTVPVDDARRLDLILAGKCLFAEPNAFQDGDGPPQRGGFSLALTVIAGDRRHEARFESGRAKGLTADLLDLAEAR